MLHQWADKQSSMGRASGGLLFSASKDQCMRKILPSEDANRFLEFSVCLHHVLMSFRQPLRYFNSSLEISDVVHLQDGTRGSDRLPSCSDARALFGDGYQDERSHARYLGKK